MRGDEPQRQVGAVADADAGCYLNFGGLPAFVADGDGTGGVKEGEAVLRAGDAEGAGEAAGPGDAHNAPDQDAAGGAIGFGDEVQALVHAVNEVDVGAAGRSEDDAGSGCDASGGMGGFVVSSQVGFDFDDRGGHGSEDEDFAQQVARHGDGIAAVEGFWEDRVGDGLAQWID